MAGNCSRKDGKGKSPACGSNLMCKSKCVVSGEGYEEKQASSVSITNKDVPPPQEKKILVSNFLP